MTSANSGPINARGAIERVSVKLPQFCRDKPVIWFIQMEAQFATCGISQDLTQFHHAIQALDGTVLSEVSETVINPPAEGKYDTLKKKVLEEFQVSEEKRLRSLLNQTDLGNQRPSKMLRTMRELALLADKIANITAPMVNAVDANQHYHHIDTEGTIAQLIRRIDRLESNISNKGRNRSRSKSRSRSKDRSTPSDRVLYKRTGIEFLIDTGADVLVIPRTRQCKSKCDAGKLYAANGTPIETFGTQQLIVDLNLRRRFVWNFVIANVLKAIIEADFLAHLHLLVDLTNRKLRDGVTDLEIKGISILTRIPSLSTLNHQEAEKYRVCGDYRRLNAATILDRYPIPHIQDFAHSLQGCKVFSKLDLRRAFYQIPVAEEDIQKTAVITPFDKCVFGASQVEYIGYLINEQGSQPIPERVKTIQEYEKPKDIQSLRKFLGMLNIYRRFLKGEDNTIEDTLSRLEEINVPTVFTQEELAEAQEKDETLKKMIDANATSLKLRKLHVNDKGTTLFCDVSGSTVSPYIPPSLRFQVFKNNHGTAHSSARATYKNISK
ncbi:uncharacterized protein [Prorops nasuta]|uniref:uncharacterized protein n=1 Tax=Prorops nasuta TaxID=863751 RepID=UPI0034CFFAAE